VNRVSGRELLGAKAFRLDVDGEATPDQLTPGQPLTVRYSS
jgi:hypothetical protein